MTDRAARENAVKNAVAITQQEGGEPSAYCSAQLALFVAGEISAREMADRVVANASRKPDAEVAES
jgi:antitoxin VbhA-like protein